jgi:MoxR-like ATPase
VLLEDFPGLGKTLAARSFAQTLGLDFARAQFTPDLLPADLTGSFVYDQRTGDFVVPHGPLFTGLLLADEINRTPPRTQAALLEAMQEHQITVEGETFVLDRRSTCSPPPTPSSTRAPTRSPKRNSTGS